MGMDKRRLLDRLGGAPMTPDYHSMVIAFLVFVVAPLLLIGIPGIVMRCKARGKRLFATQPYKRAGKLRPPVCNHITSDM